MLVRKNWETKSGSGMSQIKKFWYGYFLFGVVPLYVVMWRYDGLGHSVNCGN